jgi:ankyrin repeat protein
MIEMTKMTGNAVGPKPAMLMALLYGLFLAGGALFPGGQEPRSIHEAAAQGDRAAVRRFLASDPALLAALDEKKCTPLHRAAGRGRLEVVEDLVALGADVEAVNFDGDRPLHSAAAGGSDEVVRFLLEKSADVQAKNHVGQTPLFYAAANGRVKAAEMLLASGAAIDVKDRQGWTPLLLAAWGGQMETVRFLLARGADPELSDAIGWTPLHAAAFEGHLECVRLLAAPTLIDRPSKNGDRPLHWAIGRGHRDVAAYLLENGADPKAAGAHGLTPLPLAVELGYADIVGLLLDRGEDVLARDAVHGRTLLHRAVIRNKPETVTKLLETKIDPGAEDKHGRTALDWAERLGYADIEARLLAAGIPAGKKPALDVTWISNAGFLVSAGSDKVLIDPVFTDIGDAPTKKRSLAEFEAAGGLFRGIRLLLITHDHGDHFDPVSTGRFLSHSPGTAMLGSRQTGLTYEARTLPRIAVETAPRVMAATPGLFQALDTVVGGLKVEAFHVLHEGETPESTEAENLAFLFEVGGWRILHVGDIDGRMERRDYFEPFRRMGETGIDVAFLPCSLVENPVGADVIRAVFRPRIVVLMHYMEAQAPSFRQAIRRAGDRLPPVVLFEKSLESRRLEPAASPAGDIPSRFDWREKGIMTPVKHQMNLGSCGVFAAVAVLESLIKKETDKTVDLSEQQIINGSPDFVPSGISSVDAMKYIKRHGIVLEERLPYQDQKTKKMPDAPPDYRLADYHSVTIDKLTLAERIKTIKEAVWKHGPVAKNMIFYKDLDRYRGGVYVYDGKSEEQGGHWVVIVGWRDESTAKGGGYWICRNSWGEKWGERGYFNIAYGECGIDNFWFVYGIFKPQPKMQKRKS